MNKQTFYQYDTKNKIRVWTIEVQHVSDTLSNIITSTGIKDAPTSVIETVTPITSGKSIGRANETTIAQQAELDAQTEIKIKEKKGYVTDIALIKAKNETATIKDPMKGYQYHPRPDLDNKKDKRMTLTKLGINGKRVGIERKLDGWRYRVHVDEGGVTFYTSSGDVTLEYPQIAASLHASFMKIRDYVLDKYGIIEYYLDGEVYSHPLGFNATASACGAGKNKTTQAQLSKEQKELRDKMDFHLFDVCLDAPFTTRKKVLDYFYSNVVLPVETIYINANDVEIEGLMDQFLNEGYEGLMIRQLDMPYEYKRTKQLTKFKPMIDDEFEIVGFKKSISGDTLGSFECVMPDGTKFFANLKDKIGDDKMKKEIWDNQADYLGKWVTVDFMEYTQPKDGEPSKPRHPRAKAFRAGKSID